MLWSWKRRTSGRTLVEGCRHQLGPFSDMNVSGRELFGMVSGWQARSWSCDWCHGWQYGNCLHPTKFLAFVKTLCLLYCFALWRVVKIWLFDIQYHFQSWSNERQGRIRSVQLRVTRSLRTEVKVQEWVNALYFLHCIIQERLRVF